MELTAGKNRSTIDHDDDTIDLVAAKREQIGHLPTLTRKIGQCTHVLVFNEGYSGPINSRELYCHEGLHEVRRVPLGQYHHKSASFLMAKRGWKPGVLGENNHLIEYFAERRPTKLAPAKHQSVIAHRAAEKRRGSKRQTVGGMF